MSGEGEKKMTWKKKIIQAADFPDTGREGVWSLGRGFREVVG